MVGTELLIGGWFASAVISRVLDKIQNHIEARYQLQTNTQELIRTLTNTLNPIQATVEQAEKGTINNEGLARCLRMLKEAVYEAEDVLDNLEVKFMKEEVKGKKVIEPPISFLKRLFVSDEDHKKLEKVVKNVKRHSKSLQSITTLLVLEKNSSGSNLPELQKQQETTSQPSVEVGLYGRESELNLILDMILDATGPESSKKGEQRYNGLIVIPIVGTGGIGKTALAQAVFNHPEVQKSIPNKAWVYVRYNSSDEQVMRKIIQCLDPDGIYGNPNIDNLQLVSQILATIVAQKRCLIVLDNAFEMETIWEKLRNTLSQWALRTVVLITTQDKKFANSVRVATFSPIVLNSLEPGIFWELLKRFAFENLMMPEESRIILEDIGKQIAEKLHGLPLAAKIIGNILSSKKNEDEWRRISKSEWWDVPKVKSRILPSIGLGYEHLDPCKRQCFAYCSLFPRNTLLERERLIQLWMAQNFIPQNINGGARPEDVGREWFDELVEMSFFQPTGDNKSYVIPNLMHDLAAIVSSDECFYLNDELPVKVPQGIRHIAIDTKNLERVKEIQICKHLRSFLFFGFCVEGMYDTINETLSKLESIRVLDLSYLNMEKKFEPPPNMQNLTHIRFLDLSFTGIKVLSRAYFNHYHLQALHIQGSKIDIWPRVNKLVNLRHINTDDSTIDLISGIGQLTSLQELKEFRVDTRKGHKITELKNLREIRGCLLIKNCEKLNSNDEAKEAKLADKKHLDSIEISWDNVNRQPNIDIEILEGLKPCDDIKELFITNYQGPSFPADFMMQMFRLQKLYLSSCKCITTLPPLGELPCLKYLDIFCNYSIDIIDLGFYGRSQRVFPVLTDFCFNGQRSCKKWIKPQDVECFPHLSSLRIEKNELLSEVPLDCFSASLKKLKINDSPLRSLERYLNSPNCLTSLEITTVVQISLNIENLSLLEDLELKWCPELSIQGELQSLANLKRLTVVGCPRLLRNSMHDITSEQKGKGLKMHEGECLESLSYLEMDKSLVEFHLILGRLPSLRVLSFNNWTPDQFTEHDTLWFQQLTTLRELNFVGREVCHLPNTLVTLSSPQEMKLESCSLHHLPVDGMPPNLLKLTLKDCSKDLVLQCLPFDGRDWRRISHIPLIQIDNRTIRKFNSDEGEVWKYKQDDVAWKILDEKNARFIQ